MIMPYLKFDGDCEEAFLWYAKIFNGEIQHMLRYGDVPENSDMPMSAEQKSKVMHAQLMLTEIGGISGADSMEPIEKGGAIFIQAHLQDEVLARKVFLELSMGGTVLGELAINPPPDDSGISGCINDKYGVTWIISAMRSI